MSRPTNRRASDAPLRGLPASLSTAQPQSQSDNEASGSTARPRISQRAPGWIGLSTTSNVSMFTGRQDAPLSPARSSPGGHDEQVLSPGSIDRVFPIRSAVSIDPMATPALTQRHDFGFFPARTSDQWNSSSRASIARSATLHSTSRAPSVQSRPEADPTQRDSTPSATTQRRQSEVSAPFARLDSQTMTNILKDDASLRSENPSTTSGGVSVHSNQDMALMTARFKHVITDGGHAVVTGRDGETLQRCEDEPIHIPGAVQNFGLLVALREEGGKLVVRVVSENSKAIIGYTPQQLFKLDNFLDIFTEEQADNLLDHLDFIRDEEAGDVISNGPEVFMISVRPPQHRTRKLWCAMHICDPESGTVICEFEVEDDQVNPLVPTDDVTPEAPADTLSSNPTEEEYMDSTINISRPLRVLRSARKKRTEAAAMEVFNIMSQVQEQLANAPTLAVFLKVLIGIVKELTGFHRVMIYQFDQAWNGRVVAELVDPRATKDLYKGLHFPASDIPKQARDLYKINKVRLLYDRDQETARLVCRTMEDLEKPLDMTHANLRAMSPIHLKYLANMAVRSSMSISINAFNELWGLISCHSYGNRGTRVSFPIRKMCRLVGDTASRNIERLSYASRLQARKLINTASSASNPSGYIVASSEDLLKLFDADVGALSIRDETKILGRARGDLQEVLAMVEYLRMRKMSSIFTSQDINTDFPDLRYEPGMKGLAGVLFVPLSTGGSDFIAFFRKGMLQEVKWAGNPYEKFIKEGTEGYLEPRISFKVWTETIVGRCRDWTDEEIETASVLCLVYGKFIDVWRQKEAALQNSQLTKLLLANSAHEVRTPLNAIINYLEIALEGQLDQETRDNLAKSHSASKSLVYVINDLLDLTKAEDGQNLVKEESFSIQTAMEEATNPFSGDAKRKGLEYNVFLAPDLPHKVIGDHRRVRQVVSNLIENAIQHTSEGHVNVEAVISLTSTTPSKTDVEITVEDSGQGMTQSKVDALFKELEEVSYEDEGPDSRLLVASSPSDESQSPTEKKGIGLGLGLAVVARTIRAMNGQLRLSTEEGRGSRFVLVLSFDVDESEPTSLEQRHPPALPTASSQHSQQSDPTLSQQREVTLVQKNSGKRPTHGAMIRRESADSVVSARSGRSGRSGKSATSIKSDLSQKSDAERLIDAIQEPLRLADDQGGRPISRGKSLRLTQAGPASPKRLQKSQSLSEVGLKSAFHKAPGVEKVKDSGIPLRPVRVPEDQGEKLPKTASRVLFEEPDSLGPPSDTTETEPVSTTENFAVLVAEDDPINSKIMKKRLEKLGHSPYMTVNGEECSSLHGEQASTFDAVLMDLQMPIVDGFTSTKMIRSFEKTKFQECLSPRARNNGRIPIFAVSASLVEREREKYISVGFDGWILKPVDFQRVDLLLKGIVDNDLRNQCLYEEGKWEMGGWFKPRPQADEVAGIDTTPSQNPPTLLAEQNKEAAEHHGQSSGKEHAGGTSADATEPSTETADPMAPKAKTL